MLAEPHDVRSLAKLSLDPIDRGAGRKASYSVVGEQDDQYRRALPDEPIQCRDFGEVRLTIALEGRYGDESNAKQCHKRQANRLRQPEVGRHRAGRQDKDYEEEVGVLVDEPHCVYPSELSIQCSLENYSTLCMQRVGRDMYAARAAVGERVQLLVAERLQHRLLLDYDSVLAQPYLALPVEHHEAGHQVQAETGRNRAAGRCVPVQPDDPHRVAKVAFNPIDDGACHQAPRSEVRVHGQQHRQSLTDQRIRRYPAGIVILIASERGYRNEC